MIRRITTGVAMFTESTSFQGLTDPQRKLVKHWQACQSPGMLPHRDALDPGAMRACLSAISMVEVTPAGGIRFRLAGSGLRTLLGQEMRGRWLSDLRSDVADMWSLGLASVLEKQQPVGGMIEREDDCHAWLRLPLRATASGALILCHDERLSKSCLSLDKSERRKVLSRTKTMLAA